MAIDNFCNGFAGVALVGYMSSLTNVGYTATQYALLSSFYALPGKVLKGLSGVAVEQLEAGRSCWRRTSLFFTRHGAGRRSRAAAVLCCWSGAPMPGRHCSRKPAIASCTTRSPRAHA